MDIFFHIGKVLTSSLDPREVFHRVMRIIGQYFCAEYWSLLIIDENTDKLKFAIVKGIDERRLKDVCLEPDEGIVGWVCRTGIPQVVDDVKKDARFSDRLDKLLGFKTKSVVCVPIVNGNNRILGAIEMVNKFLPGPRNPNAKKVDPNRNHELTPFTESDMKILTSIGVFAGIAVENAFLHKKVTDLSLHDPLTGLHNRLFFTEAFLNEIDRVIRYKHTICILMMDMDGLKKINDHHGHHIGDMALREIAEILKKTIRESDTLARYGGDEFVIMLPRAGRKDGEMLAGRIQHAIAGWNMKPKIPGVQLSLSIGLESGGPENIDDILILADRKMYENKYNKKCVSGDFPYREFLHYLWKPVPHNYRE